MLLNYIKRGAYNTLTYTASSVFTRIISFFFLPYFLSKLSLNDFGIWDFYQMFFSIGTLVISSSAATGLTRFYLLYKDDREKQRQAIGNALGLTFICSLIFPIIAFTLLSFIYSSPLSSNYLAISILNISFFSLFSLILAYLRVKEYLWSYFFIYSGQNLLAILLTVLAIQYGFGINGFFYANGFSFIIFFPFFLSLLFKHWTFSLSLFKEQLKYSIPLLLYSILYGFFFIIDRLVLKNYGGYETLGTYGLLWRFGNIFQFFSIALTNSAYIIFCNAQKEKNSNHLISKLITYFCLALTTVSLITLIGSRFVIGFFLPEQYLYLIYYLPLFFLPLICLEIARLMQIGIQLSNYTVFSPILTIIALGTQCISLFCLQSFGLWGIFIGNAFSFTAFGLANYRASSILYSQKIINFPKIIKIFCLFILYLSFLHLLFLLNASWYWSILFFTLWPVLLWLVILDGNEKNFIYQKLTHISELTPRLNN